MNRDSWHRDPWDMDPRFMSNVVIPEHSLQNLVRTAADLKARLEAAEGLLLRQAIIGLDVDRTARAA